MQSDLVSTSTRWCLPLAPQPVNAPLIQRAQLSLDLKGQTHLLDTPNPLAVPMTLLRRKVMRLGSDDQLRVEAALDFMLRGY